MRIFAQAVVPALLIALALAPVADADTMYSYVSGPFDYVSGVYTLEDRITGSFTVAEGFVPASGLIPPNYTPGIVSWSFTDGHQTLTEANSIGSFNFSPFSSVNIQYWHINLVTPDGSGRIELVNLFGYLDKAVLGDSSGRQGTDLCPGPCGGVYPESGTWTVQTVPEPATVVLVAVGLLVVAAGWRRHTIAP